MYELPETKEHPLRRELNDEVHARPPDSLATPSQITYLTRLPDRARIVGFPGLMETP